MEKVIRTLSNRGFKVGAIKHSSQDFEIDIPSKDSYKLSQAGAVAVGVVSARKVAMYREVEDKLSCQEMADLLGEDLDLVLGEGFKKEKMPKIEVVRAEISRNLLELEGRIAIVTDLEFNEVDVPVFSFGETDFLCDFIVEKFLTRKEDRPWDNSKSE